mgnify:FL=1
MTRLDKIRLHTQTKNKNKKTMMVVRGSPPSRARSGSNANCVPFDCWRCNKSMRMGKDELRESHPPNNRRHRHITNKHTPRRKPIENEKKKNHPLTRDLGTLQKKSEKQEWTKESSMQCRKGITGRHVTLRTCEYWNLPPYPQRVDNHHDGARGRSEPHAVVLTLRCQRPLH